MTDNICPFHLAIPVSDIQKAHDFYTNVLGCSVGRQDQQWMDFDFFGHQLVAHLVSDSELGSTTNPVDGEDVPSRHFGIIMHMPDWEDLVQHLQEKKIKSCRHPWTCKDNSIISRRKGII